MGENKGQLKPECFSEDAVCDGTVPLAEGVQAGQNLRVVVVLQANAAHQELLVYLSHHRAGAARLPLGHGERHSRGEEYEAHTPLSLQKHREKRGGRQARETINERKWTPVFVESGEFFQIRSVQFNYKGNDIFAGKYRQM